MPPQTLNLSLHRAIAEIPAAEWDALAGGDNPFTSHAFLSALEDSGSANARTGWLPQHAVLRDEAGTIMGCAPAYAKSHSYGEYVFDHGWAQAFERAGGEYYPKLQVAVPFSPVPGRRLMGGMPVDVMGGALRQATQEIGFSSCHVTFCGEDEARGLEEAGWLRRTGVQFHWSNAGFASFDDFLALFRSSKRKAIRRERRDAQSAGLVFRSLRGAEITPRHWRVFNRCYQNTVDRKWGSAYLTEKFWPLMADRLGDRVVLMVAEKDGEPVACALNLIGADTLYGRNWGALVEAPFLHFELCYYQAIDFAIANGLSRVEAGAQGEHKIQRGYLPVATHSAHWIEHRGLRAAIADFLARERMAMAENMAELAAGSPFRRAGEDA